MSNPLSPGQAMFDVTYNPNSVQLSNFQDVPEPGTMLIASLASICAALLHRHKNQQANE